MGQAVHQIFGININANTKSKAGHANLFDKKEKAEMKYFHSLEAAQDYQAAHPELSRERITQFNAVHNFAKWMIFPAYSYHLQGVANNLVKFYPADLLSNKSSEGAFRVLKTDCYATPETKKILLSQKNCLVGVSINHVSHENYEATMSLVDKDATDYIYVDNYGDCWAVNFLDKNAKLEDRQIPGLQWDDRSSSIKNC